ncbi:MAG: NAD(P)H-hydrate dehydratase [Flammeovirgaceae bacterium]|nr:NAD(P)H-hydrate dehydratase [Flammeovirgaceae bacterium]
MLKILTTSQIKELDAYTIKHEPIPSIDLMERACVACCSWITSKFKSSKKIGVVCGPGNNGGDGLGIARLLSQKGYRVTVWMVNERDKTSEDFKINKSRLPKHIELNEVKKSHSPDFSQVDVLIDALFGSGLTRPVEGIYEVVIKSMNNVSAARVAIDIPSGLMSDSVSTGAIVCAEHTLTFQLPKLAFMMSDNSGFIGEWVKLDIGLNKEYIKSADTKNFLLTLQSVRKKIKSRDKFSHKGDYGAGLLIAGATGKMGACVLSSRAALRSGIGLLTVHVPGNGYSIIQSSVPEAMALIDPDKNQFSACPDVANFDTVGIGPGIGQSDISAKALLQVIEKCTSPMVIDADGLNLLAVHREGLTILPAGTILTPHPKEFDRLAGESKNDFERLEKAKALSTSTKCVIILKGAHSAIVLPTGKIYFNNTGNPGMASGGSGDVLTGILTALLAQGYSPEDAALLGTFVHGRAGDLAANQKGPIGMIASDIIEWLPVGL